MKASVRPSGEIAALSKDSPGGAITESMARCSPSLGAPGLTSTNNRAASANPPAAANAALTQTGLFAGKGSDCVGAV